MEVSFRRRASKLQSFKAVKQLDLEYSTGPVPHDGSPL